MAKIPFNASGIKSDGTVDLQNNRIINIGAPSDPSDVTNKEYVDAIPTGNQTQLEQDAIPDISVSKDGDIGIRYSKTDSISPNLDDPTFTTPRVYDISIGTPSGGTMIIVTNGTNKYKYSSDLGNTWLDGTFPDHGGTLVSDRHAVMWVPAGSGQFVAFPGGDIATTGNDLILYSTDGINWTSTPGDYIDAFHPATNRAVPLKISPETSYYNQSGSPYALIASDGYQAMTFSSANWIPSADFVDFTWGAAVKSVHVGYMKSVTYRSSQLQVALDADSSTVHYTAGLNGGTQAASTFNAPVSNNTTWTDALPFRHQTSGKDAILMVGTGTGSSKVQYCTGSNFATQTEYTSNVNDEPLNVKFALVNPDANRIVIIGETEIWYADYETNANGADWNETIKTQLAAGDFFKKGSFKGKTDEYPDRIIGTIGTDVMVGINHLSGKVSTSVDGGIN